MQAESPLASEVQERPPSQPLEPQDWHWVSPAEALPQQARQKATSPAWTQVLQGWQKPLTSQRSPAFPVGTQVPVVHW
jgi:hypothetical protein